jgi:hypothetical protein
LIVAIAIFLLPLNLLLAVLAAYHTGSPLRALPGCLRAFMWACGTARF